MNDTLHILIVDDEPGMLAGAERALRGLVVDLPEVGTTVQFTIGQAASGEEALERMASQPPQILLLDHKLPGISGLDVLNEVTRKGLDTLTIMITAFASLETAVEAIRSGAYDFLAKPFTPAELKSAVRKATSRIVFERQARKLASEKRRVRFEFISVLAHELKSPLAAVEGYLRIIKDGTAGDDQAAQDHMLARSLARLEGMRKLILDLLDLTRIESGQRNREIVAVDLKDVAASAVETFAAAAAGADVTLALCGESVPMRADRGELEIVLNNLISNAIKYNRPQGRVDVTVSSRDGAARIEVADTGIGMTEAECALLFKEFARIKNDKTRSILGSGLGLSIVKKLATLYGGDASVSSRPGIGTTFTVHLAMNAPDGKEATGNSQQATERPA